VTLFDSALVRLLPAVPKPVVQLFSSRYIAGATLAEAVECVRGLNAGGSMATVDVLGEEITREEETRAIAQAYRDLFAAIDEAALDSNVSVKLTALGLELSYDLCRENLVEVVRTAAGYGNFVRIDMEDSSVTQATLDLFRRARTEFDNVGIVLQAYLRRTQADIERAIAERWNVRICKGIYVEPREIAFRDPDLIRRNYAYTTDRLLEARVPVGIATHDEAMVLEALHSIERRQARREDYEFQMLMGVAVGLRRLVLRQGHRLRVYVPYGTAWRGYSLRRLKENPAIVRHVLAGMFRREG
jgi:proline dehydrogenase